MEILSRARKVNVDFMIASFDLLNVISFSIGTVLAGSFIYTIFVTAANRKLKHENRLLELSIKQKEIDDEAQSLSDEALADRLRALAAEDNKRRNSKSSRK